MTFESGAIERLVTHPARTHDVVFYGVVHGAGSVVMGATFDGWLPVTHTELFDAVYDAPRTIRGGVASEGLLVGHAVEMIQDEAWWIDLPMRQHRYSRMDMSVIRHEPCEVFEVDYVDTRGEIVIASSLLGINLCDVPFEEDELDSFHKLVAAIASAGSTAGLDKLDQIIIAPPRERDDTGFIYLTQTTVMIGRGILNLDESDSATTAALYAKIASYYRGTDRPPIANLEVFRVNGYRHTVARPSVLVFAGEDYRFNGNLE